MTTPSLLYSVCERCGDPFLGDDDDTVCPRCRAKEREWR